MTDLIETIDQLEEVAKSRASMGFKLFDPYEPQQDFVKLTAEYDNLCLSGGNRTGKTSLAGRYLIPIWATGEYPEGWTGRKWDRPVTIWMGSTDWTTNIDGCQKALLGNAHLGKDHAGVAFWDDVQGQMIPCGIPSDAIHKIEYNPLPKGSISRVWVNHKSGGLSEIRFISYLQGRERLQAGKVDAVWMDEEPPEEIATELAARTIDSRGLSILTFTPLKGISDVIKAFIGDAVIDDQMPKVLRSSVGVLVRMSAYDVPHLDAETIESMKRRYPKYQWPARIEGIPALGEGAIYPFDDEFLTVDAFEIPAHWRVLDAIDFGFQHPTARVRVTINPDTKDIYLIQDYKDNLKTPVMHMKEWESQFKWRVPVAWPHDGRNKETDGHSKIAKYKQLGMLTLQSPVKMPNQKGSVMSFEGSVQILYDLMAEGKFKVFRGCRHFFSEKSLYRREKRKNAIVAEVVKKNDDVMDAVRYGVMSILCGYGFVVDTARREAVGHDVYAQWEKSPGTYLDFDPFE